MWGVRDSDKKVVGITVNLDRDIDGEPYKHYLFSHLKPNIPFETTEYKYNELRIVMIIIPTSKSVVTKFKNQYFFTG